MATAKKKAAPAKAGKPIAKKPAAAKASKPAAKRPASKTTAVKKPAVKKPVAKKPAASKKAAPAKKPGAKKPVVAKKAAPAKKLPVKKPVAKKAAPIKATAKPVAKKAAPAKAAAKPVAKKPAPVSATPTVKKATPAVTKTTTAAPARATKAPALASTMPNASGLSEAQVLKMADKDYMNDNQLAFFKAKLLAMKDEILANARETGEHLKENEVFADPNDRATVEEENMLEQRVRDRERKLLKKIDSALRRIEAGEYGYCLETGEPIGVARLIARPTAELSIEAQEKHERRERLYAD